MQVAAMAATNNRKAKEINKQIAVLFAAVINVWSLIK
jgi:hypothetical protein